MSYSQDAAKYGRSSSGKTKLISEYESDLKSLKSAVKSGKARTNLETVIKNNWSGVDADKFLKNIQNTGNTIVQTATNAEKALQTAVNSDFTQFKKNQSTHL